MQCYANLYHKRFQFFKSYTPFIQCLTENNGRYTRCFQLANILGTTHSATGYKVKVGMRFQHLFIQRYGRTLQHTVAIDVGTDDFTNTFLDIIFQKREQFASTLSHQLRELFSPSRMFATSDRNVRDSLRQCYRPSPSVHRFQMQ